jgi:hypothetical protein
MLLNMATSNMFSDKIDIALQQDVQKLVPYNAVSVYLQCLDGIYSADR